MKFLVDARVSVKLGAAFFAVLLLTTLTGAVSLLQIGKVNANAEELATNWLPSIEVLGDLRGAFNQMRRAEAQRILAVTEEEIAAADQRQDRARKAADEAEKRYLPMVTPGEEKDNYEQYKPLRDAYFSAHQQLNTLILGGAKTHQDAKAYYEQEALKAFDAMLGKVQDLIDVNRRGGDESRDAARSTFRSAIIWVGVLMAIAIACGAALATLITRAISRPLEQAVGLCERVAGGDLSMSIPQDRRDEIGQLFIALGGMVAGLEKVVSEVRTGVDQVSTASGQIAAGNQDLSSRTEHQASSLEETAASLEQLTSTGRQSADNARQASQLATAASSAAANGGEVVGQVVATMDEISASSRRIAEITSVIDGIAFQTNILALNAAVEAARAGDQGRGFAVVAAEVRSLAQRSAQAAREIKNMIGDSVNKVEAGSRLVNEAGTSITDIVHQVKRVTDLIGEITCASMEQSGGIGQINAAVVEMDRVTQQNAALVEQSAAAAASLKQQADRLSRVVSVFRVRSTASG